MVIESDEEIDSFIELAESLPQSPVNKPQCSSQSFNFRDSFGHARTAAGKYNIVNGSSRNSMYLLDIMCCGRVYKMNSVHPNIEMPIGFYNYSKF